LTAANTRFIWFVSVACVMLGDCISNCRLAQRDAARRKAKGRSLERLESFVLVVADSERLRKPQGQ
jgi:hypothetical protein